jgi:hypothetical protein
VIGFCPTRGRPRAVFTQSLLKQVFEQCSHQQHAANQHSARHQRDFDVPQDKFIRACSAASLKTAPGPCTISAQHKRRESVMKYLHSARGTDYRTDQRKRDAVYQIHPVIHSPHRHNCWRNQRFCIREPTATREVSGCMSLPDRPARDEDSPAPLFHKPSLYTTPARAASTEHACCIICKQINAQQETAHLTLRLSLVRVQRRSARRFDARATRSCIWVVP